jgi:ribosomal protein S27AE
MRDPSWMKLSEDIRAKSGNPAANHSQSGAGGVPATDAAPVDDRPYEGDWAEYRAHWRAFWMISVVGWLTIAGLVWLLPRVGAEGVLALLFPLWGLAWFVSTIVAVAKVVAFSCPRCGNAFFTPFKSPLLQWKCRSCGLTKFAPNDRPRPFRRVP